MKKKYTLRAASLALMSSTHLSFAAGINVPGDFPGSFAMDLLAGNAYWDFTGNTGCSSSCDGFELTIRYYGKTDSI